MPTWERRLRKEAREREARRLAELPTINLAGEIVPTDGQQVEPTGVDVNDELGQDKYPDGLFGFDNDGPGLIPTIGAGGNTTRRDNKEVRIDAIKQQFARYLGRPGAAKRIADEYRTDEGEQLTRRTIERYLKEIG